MTFHWSAAHPAAGDFYHHEGRIDIELTVPEGWRVQSEILESR